MHLVNCQYPKRCHNPYTDEDMLVSCGHCDICMSRRASTWVNRLELERMVHKYCIFFTLTYAEDFVPKCIVGADQDSLVNCQTGEVLSFRQLGLYEPYMANSRDYVLNRGWICCPHVPYLQNFIKRLRSKLIYYENNPSAKRLRYHIATEYGPTTHRIHYHGALFFESDWLAEHAKEIITEAWSTDNRDSVSVPLGKIDVQFVDGQSNAMQYVAAYLNCTAHLPEIYSQRPFRPFALFSRSPAIGSVCFKSEEISEIFDKCLVRIPMLDRRNNKFVLRPLPHAFEDRLYPRIKGFGQINHTLRVGLYGLLLKTQSFVNSYTGFKEYLYKFFPEYEVMDKLSSSNEFLAATNKYLEYPIDSSVKEYLAKTFFNYDTEPRLLELKRRRFYSCLNRFEMQRHIFGLSVEEYVTRIENYFSKKDSQNLSEQLECEEDISELDGIINCMFVDTLFVDNVKNRGYLTEREHLILSSYGWDFREEDYMSFLDRLKLDNFTDYVNLLSDAHSRVEKTTKTKIKNEYVSAHMSNSLIHAIYGK